MTRRRQKKASHGEGHLFRKKKNGKPYGNYFIRYYEDGRRCCKNLHTTDYAEAKRQWHEWVLTREKQRGRPFSDKVEVLTWLKAYMGERHRSAFDKGSIKPSTYEKYAQIAGNFTRFLKSQYPGLQMCDLTKDVFDDYMTWRSNETRRRNKSKIPITRIGVNGELDFLATIFRKAVKQKVIEDNPVTDVERFGVDQDPTEDPSPWSLEDVKMIIQEVTDDARDAVAFVALTGCRRGEMAHLRWRDIRFEDDEVRINGNETTQWTPKTKHGYRWVPMAKELRRILVRRKKASPGVSDDDAVFTRPGGHPLHTWPDFALRRFQEAIARLQKGGKDVKRGSLRTLRHWFISHAINCDIDPLSPLEVQRIVGHGNLEMIEKVYYHPDRPKVKRKLRSFGEGLLGE